jgi:hypothetical protein
VELLKDFYGVIKVKVWVVSLLFLKFIVIILNSRYLWRRGIL